jgi:CDP-diacylglycerol--glycerol-3-phosphate 3-phosphatidyltransferase
MRGNNMNLANKLTIFRVILVPIFVIVGYLGTLGIITGEWLGIPTSFWIMNVIFIIASITDKLDGYIARSRNQVTTFGKFLDPLADKILVLSALVILVEFGKIPAWIPIIVLTREFLVSGYRLIAVEKGGKVIAASIWGKLKTVTQMIAIILVFVDKFNFFNFMISNTNKVEAMSNSIQIYMTSGEIVLNIITSVIMLVSVVATIFSGYDYLKNGKDLFKEEN